MPTIEGLDVSKYQGVLTSAIVEQIVAAGIRFVQVRFSQGTGYRDPQAENNTLLLQAGGVKVGPYHFTTNDNATQQYNNFVDAMKDFQFDTIPWMDCEAYTAVAGRYLDLPPMREPGLYQAKPPKERHLEFLRASNANPYKLAFFRLMPQQLYSYSYPSSAVVDSLGRQLMNGWMKTQTKLSYSEWPAIYTNASSGNTIFGSNTAFAKYPLAVANWTTAPFPYLPKAWQGKAYYIWQDGVIDASPYGLDSLKVDHDRWGDLFPFPGEEPPPPPPPPPPPNPDWYDVELTDPVGTKWFGRVNRV